MLEGPQNQRAIACVEVLIELRGPVEATGGAGRMNLPDLHAKQPASFDQERIASVHRPAGHVLAVGHRAPQPRQAH